MSGFYLYEFKNVTSCEVNPNFGQPLLGKISDNGGCVVTIPSARVNGANGTDRVYNFDVI